MFSQTVNFINTSLSTVSTILLRKLSWLPTGHLFCTLSIKFFYNIKKLFYWFYYVALVAVMFQYQMKISKWWFHKVEYFRCIVEIVWPVTVYFLSSPECFLESKRNRLCETWFIAYHHHLGRWKTWPVLYFLSVFLLSFSAFLSPPSPCPHQEER